MSGIESVLNNNNSPPVGGKRKSKKHKSKKSKRKTRSKRQRGAADPTPDAGPTQAVLAARAAALDPWNREVDGQIANLRRQLEQPPSPTSTATTNFEGNPPSGGKRKTRKAKKSKRKTIKR
jgi:hypothetical protein